MDRKLTLLTRLALVLSMGGTAYGATYTVGAGGDYATFEDAVAQANANAGEDTLLLLDSAYTSNGSPTLVSESLTITYDPGNTGPIMIEKTSGTGQVIRNTALSGFIKVLGRSPDAPITLKNSASASPCINTGPDASTTMHWEVTNAVLERPSAGSAGAFLNFNGSNYDESNSEPHVLTNVVFRGGDSSSTATANILLGMTAGNNARANLTNCDFSQAANGGPVINHGGLEATFTNCTFTNTSANRPVIAQQVDPSGSGTTLTFKDCTFESEGPLLTPAYGGATYRFYRPVFTGKCGDVMFDMGDHYNWVKVYGSDDEGNALPGGVKTDLTPAVTAGTARIACMTDGSLRLQDLTLTQRPSTATVDGNTGADVTGMAIVGMYRCVWVDGAGDFVANSSGGSAGFALYAENCIWRGTTSAASILSTKGLHSGQSWIGLYHCTLAINTENAFFMGNADDYVDLDGSIIFTTRITDSLSLSNIRVGHHSGIPNVIWVNATEGSGAPYQGDAGLADTGDLVQDPKLDTQAKQTASSPGLGRAVGSTLTVDFEGDPRPLGDPDNDIGADESSFNVGPPVDTDGDGMPDTWEDQYGFDKGDPADAAEDPDGDGSTNLEEYLGGTDPLDPASRLPLTGVVGLAALVAGVGAVAVRKIGRGRRG